MNKIPKKEEKWEQVREVILNQKLINRKSINGKKEKSTFSPSNIGKSVKLDRM